MDLSCFTSITVDSRQVRPGSLFLAYPGEKSDGRDFVAAAISQGASGIMYEAADGWQPPPSSVQTHWWPMENLAAQAGMIAAQFFNYPSQFLDVIGVTGTNGKSSITHFVAQAFALHQQKCAVMGTLGNGFLPDLAKTTHTTLFGVPLQQTLAAYVTAQAQYVAMEVSSHALDQGRVNGVQFDTAVFSNLSRDHMDYHKNMQHYFASKAKLFALDKLNYAIINYDDAYAKKLLAQPSAAQQWLYSCDDFHASLPTIVATEIAQHQTGFAVKVQTPWGAGEFETDLLGRFNISNLLATLTVLCLHGINLFDALYYLSKIKPVAGRMQQFKTTQSPLTIVDYAHTPDALEKTLAAIKEHVLGKIICVFGCGGDRDKGKRPLMAQAAQKYADTIIVTNDNPRSENPQHIANEIVAGFSNGTEMAVILDRQQAIVNALQQATTEDVVLIAGKGHENYQIIGKETFPFDDAAVVKHYLQGLDI